jgi:LPXTG-motif cell wall-anchored protein
VTTRRFVELAGTFAAMLVALATVGALTPTPAAATFVRPSTDCVRVNADGSFRVVWSYRNSLPTTVTLRAGSTQNTISPGVLNGTQPSSFAPGEHLGAYATATVPAGTTVSWRLDGWTVTANAASPGCAGSVSLPATGNGTGPLLAVAGGLLVLASAVGGRRLRRRGRTDEGTDAVIEGGAD